MRYGMMIELDRCVGCKACVSACKERWDSGPGVARNWVREFEAGTRETGLEVTFYPGLCMHCEQHPCTQDCPTGATFADERGVVRVDPDLCIGCGNCVQRCPYGARVPDGKKGIVEKCDLCTAYVARGESPACVAACLAQCRTFGDLDARDGELVRRIRERGAEPLVSSEIDVGPKVYFAPPRARRRLLAEGAIRKPKESALSHVWSTATRPAAQIAVPALAAVAGLGGLMINLRSRAGRVRVDEGSRRLRPSPANETAHGGRQGVGHAPPDASEPKAPRVATHIRRHSVGMRFLHWFNAASWLLLLATGTALMATPAFALFGTSLPAVVAAWFGGAANLLWVHVAWGLLWASVIVPFFLYFKRGGVEALREIAMTRDDMGWLLAKPKALLGIGDGRLPPQDKYNAGQKLFAIAALLGTTLIIATGLVMAFHWGSAGVVATALLLHKLAIMLILAGLAVHITMAAILAEERPALRSMIQGEIELEHAARHARKWVDELVQRREEGSQEQPGNSVKHGGDTT